MYLNILLSSSSLNIFLHLRKIYLKHFEQQTFQLWHSSEPEVLCDFSDTAQKTSVNFMRQPVFLTLLFDICLAIKWSFQNLGIQKLNFVFSHSNVNEIFWICNDFQIMESCCMLMLTFYKYKGVCIMNFCYFCSNRSSRNTNVSPCVRHKLI